MQVARRFYPCRMLSIVRSQNDTPCSCQVCIMDWPQREQKFAVGGTACPFRQRRTLSLAFAADTESPAQRNRTASSDLRILAKLSQVDLHHHTRLEPWR